MAPAHDRSLNRHRLYSVEREDPAYELGSDRNRDGTSQSTAPWRQVAEFAFTGERLTAGGELTSAPHAHALVPALHQRTAPDDCRPAGGGHRSRVGLRDCLLEILLRKLLLVLG